MTSSSAGRAGMRRERASTPAARAHLPTSLVLVGRARTPAPAARAWVKTHTAAGRLAPPHSWASTAVASGRRRMTMKASGSRTGKEFQHRTQASAAGSGTTRTRESAAESGARRIAASPGQALPMGRKPRSRAWAAMAPRGTPTPAAQAWAKTHTEAAAAAVRTLAPAAQAWAWAWAKTHTDSAAGSDRASVHTDSGPAGRTVPIQIRAAGSSDTPLAVDCGQPSGTGFHLRVCSEAEPGPTHFQVHAPVNASAPATTSSYVPLIGMPMR